LKNARSAPSGWKARSPWYLEVGVEGHSLRPLDLADVVTGDRDPEHAIGDRPLGSDDLLYLAIALTPASDVRRLVNA